MSHDNDRIDIDYELAPPDRLDAYHRRQLSAMLDGELSPDQARFMLRRLQHDGELAARWERWQVCGDVLRGRGHALLPADFSRRVAEAIAAPAGAAGPAAAIAAGARPARTRHRMLRWGGGALAASMALVALFMARQLPDAGEPGLVEATSVSRPALAVMEPAPAIGATAPEGVTTPVEGDGTGNGDPLADTAAALLAAAPAAVAVAEVPRRAAERSSTRSQSQRAAARRAQAAVEAPARAVAAAAQFAPATALDGDALFGALPEPAIARPWPRAVLPGLSAQPFAAGHGLPQDDAFAPFQPRPQAGLRVVPASSE